MPKNSAVADIPDDVNYYSIKGLPDMAQPAYLPKPLNIYRGDTFSRTLFFGVKDPSTGVVTGVDLSAYGDTWSAELRRSEDSNEGVAFTVNTDNLSEGKVTLVLPSAAVDTLPSKGVWDLQVVDNGQNPPYVRTMSRGTFVLYKDVTR